MAGECPGWYCALLSATKSGDATASQVGSGLLTTNTVTITPVGGVAGYTFSWARVSGSTGPAIDDAAGQTVSWSETNTAPLVHTATWRCTVTDGASNSVTVDVGVDLNWG
jgi:hypothetical protein